MIWLSIIIALIILIIGSITDLKKREVHDYVSYGLVFLAFGVSIIYSIIYSDYTNIMQTIFGFIAGVIIAYTMFYLGQWGGGDSKLIIGLGAVIGFNTFQIFGQKNYWFLILLVNTVFVGAFYGLLWSIYLGVKHRKEFMKNLKIWSMRKEIIRVRRILMITTLVSCILILLFMGIEFKLMLLGLIALVFVVFYLWIFVKIIEESCMIKKVAISKLTEGDWIFEDIRIGKKYVAGPKDLGISREQIALLKRYEKQKKIKFVAIKEGIPFIPAFLIAFILTMMMYAMNMSYYISLLRIIGG